jgi:hypothetical protein
MTSTLWVLVLLGLFVTAVTRTGLWFLGERTAQDATTLALRAGGAAVLAGLGLIGLMRLIGPATVTVLPVLLLLACSYLARRARGASDADPDCPPPIPPPMS